MYVKYPMLFERQSWNSIYNQAMIHTCSSSAFIHICQMTLANLMFNAQEEGNAKTIFSKDKVYIFSHSKLCKFNCCCWSMFFCCCFVLVFIVVVLFVCFLCIIKNTYYWVLWYVVEALYCYIGMYKIVYTCCFYL